MEVTCFYKNLSKQEEEIFNEYLTPKLKGIKNLLSRRSQKESSLLKISVEKFEKHTAYKVEFHLTLPMRSLIAAEDSHDITKAIDLSKDRLVEQIKKYKAQLRGSRSHKTTIKNKQPLLELEAVVVN